GGDLTRLERITLPEHLRGENIGKLYRENKYRLVLSDPAYSHLMQYLEAGSAADRKYLLDIIHGNMDLRHVARAADERFSFATMILKGQEIQDMPAEDEGIPGHRPGNAISSTDPNIGNVLAKIKTGRYERDALLQQDVRAELEELDGKEPPVPGQPTYV